MTVRAPLTSCRLGLATRGNTHLTADDIWHALERGIQFLNWCGTPDALSQVIGELGSRRAQVKVCVQCEARTARDAQAELKQIMQELRIPAIDILTFYYVEELSEWAEISGPGGALEYCRAAQRAGEVNMLGLTTHQRSLAAKAAQSGLLDLLMIRYNAAHRGAETDVFAVTDALGLPVVVYTCLRWGALLRSTPADPPGFVVPRAPAWYRFVLQNPSVAVALMAPNKRHELDEDLSVLAMPALLDAQDYIALAEHGQRVRRHAGQFP